MASGCSSLQERGAADSGVNKTNGVSDGDESSSDGSDDDTSEERIKISTPSDFELIRENPSQKFELLNDIDFNGILNFQPIQADGMDLEGNNFKILNLRLEKSATTDYVGIFSKLSNSNVNHLKLVNIVATGARYVGALAGEITKSQVKNIELNKITVVGSYRFGGLAGRASDVNLKTSNFSFINLFENADADDLGQGAGGVFGYVDVSVIRDIDVQDLVIQISETQAGGVAGLATGTRIQDASLENIQLAAKNRVGGFVGSLNEASTLKLSKINSAEISALVDGGSYLGGFVGVSEGSDDGFSEVNQVSGVEVVVIGEKVVGGAVGRAKKAIFKDSYVFGEVKALEGYASKLDTVGGFVGDLLEGSEVQNSYASIKLPETTSPLAIDSEPSTQDIYAFVGGVDATSNVVGCFANKGAMSPDFPDEYASLLTSQEMKNQQNFLDAGWDYDNIWTQSANDYPRLQ